MRNVLPLCLCLAPLACKTSDPRKAEDRPARGVTDVDLKRLCSVAWESEMRDWPRRATKLGDRRYDGELEDNSRQAAGRRARERRELLDDLRAIDREGLSPRDRVTFDVLLQRWTVELALHDSGVAPDTWNLNALDGPAAEFPKIEQPAETEGEQELVLARWHAMPAYLARASENLVHAMSQGLVASRTATERTLAQLDALLATPPQDSPLVTVLSAEGTLFRRELLAVVDREVYPAFAGYRDLIRGQILPRARPDEKPGVQWAPEGNSFYALCVRRHTTLDLDPADVHEIGKREVERIRAEMSALGAALFGTSDLSEIQERLRSDPDLHFATAAEVKAKAEETLARAETVVPKAFGKLPKAPCEVVEVPELEAPFTTIAYYEQPAADGSRPGRYYVNTYQPTTRPRYDAEVLGFHEAVPGHHTQVALAQELRDLPAVRRYGEETAFVEGWALYTERLCDELGLYTSDLDRLGMLSFDAWRAARLVVDTGLHAFGWSRQTAIDYMLENTLLAENNVENEVDRYIAWPGQALAYKIGQLEILSLRAKARAALGKRFSLAEFHDRVLENGPLPLAVLRQRIETWLEGR